MNRQKQGGRKMTPPRQKRAVLAGIGMLVALLFLGAGCSVLKSSKGKTSSPAVRQKSKGASPLYYDFGDVLVPSELKVDRDSSFVYRTPGFSAGVLVLKGRVEMSSLIAFFENNMTKDNWQPVSSFKSPRTIMLFHKENRWCVINISEKEFNTHVEIWVAPTSTEAGSGLLK